MQQPAALRDRKSRVPQIEVAFRCCPPSLSCSKSCAIKGRHAPPELVVAARHRFLTQGLIPDVDICPTILRSWRRCAARGLDVATGPAVTVLSPHLLREVQEHNEELLRAARAEMEALSHDVGLTGGVVILTDPKGVILASIGAGEFAEQAARMALRPGAGWDEATIGTNAIGAALAERQPVSVISAEHFFDMYSVFTCSAVPIVDPCGEVAGVLDVTNAWNVPHVLTLALVTRAVEQIERRLFENRFGGCQQVHFHHDASLIGSSREGVLAFEDDKLVGANRQGLGLLNLDWRALGRYRFGELFSVQPVRQNHHTFSDIRPVQTMHGRTLFARVQSPRFMGVDLSADLPDMGEELRLGEIVDQLLGGPLARQIDVRRVKTGQLIYGADQEEGLLVVRRGRLRCFASFEGKELTFFMLDAGDGVPVHARSIFEVKKDGEIVMISMEAFRRLARCEPRLALAAMPVVDRILQKSLQMNEDMVFRGVRQRLIRALTDTAERDGRKLDKGIVLDAPPNAEDFAMQVGATRQSVSTVIADLIRDGIIRRLGGSAMVIPDLNRLKAELDPRSDYVAHACHAA